MFLLASHEMMRMTGRIAGRGHKGSDNLGKDRKDVQPVIHRMKEGRRVKMGEHDFFKEIYAILIELYAKQEGVEIDYDFELKPKEKPA